MIWGREEGGKGVSAKNQCNLVVVIQGRKCKTCVVVVGEPKMKSCDSMCTTSYMFHFTKLDLPGEWR
jgi:hypothetical protein